MKVNLIKEAYYEINEKKSSFLPFSTFMKMCGVTPNGKEQSDDSIVTPPNVRFFSKIDDFRSLTKSELDKFDTSKDVIILPSGEICVFLKLTQDNITENALELKKNDENAKSSVNTKEQQNVAANTKEDPEDKATDLK